MASNLTGSTIANTYNQLLHVDGGPEATPKTVFSGTGVATAVKVGTLGAEVGNIRFVSNTVSSVNANGDMNFTPNGTGSVVISKVTFSDATQARTALSLGSLATQDFDDVAITGGSVVATTALGYAASVYGTVTQATDKSTAVTLNSLAGRITMNDATLASNTDVIFTLDNSILTGNDLLVVNIAGGGTPGAYRLDICCNVAGSAVLKLSNTTGGSLSEAVQILFAVITEG